MNALRKTPGALLLAAALAAGGCASHPSSNLDAMNARVDLNALKEDPALSSRAPAAIADAETAVLAAEAAQRRRGGDVKHAAYIADRKVAIARAQAQDRLAADEMVSLAQERERIQTARNGYRSGDIAMMESGEYRRELSELGARESDRGMVVTLGGLEFPSGRADLKAGNRAQLEQLTAFLEHHPERTVIIEGHTDSRGSEQANLRLSLRRAEAVKRYLVGKGVAAERIKTVGRGEEVPLAGNDDAQGREQNRRVDVVIQTSS